MERAGQRRPSLCPALTPPTPGPTDRGLRDHPRHPQMLKARRAYLITEGPTGRQVAKPECATHASFLANANQMDKAHTVGRSAPHEQPRHPPTGDLPYAHVAGLGHELTRPKIK